MLLGSARRDGPSDRPHRGFRKSDGLLRIAFRGFPLQELWAPKVGPPVARMAPVPSGVAPPGGLLVSSGGPTLRWRGSTFPIGGSTSEFGGHSFRDLGDRLSKRGTDLCAPGGLPVCPWGSFWRSGNVPLKMEMRLPPGRRSPFGKAGRHGSSGGVSRHRGDRSLDGGDSRVETSIRWICRTN